VGAKTETISIRLSKEERQQLEALARAYGQTPSEFLRTSALRGSSLEALEKRLVEQMAELTKQRASETVRAVQAFLLEV